MFWSYFSNSLSFLGLLDDDFYYFFMNGEFSILVEPIFYPVKSILFYVFLCEKLLDFDFIKSLELLDLHFLGILGLL
jgi:hypothetical protein